MAKGDISTIDNGGGGNARFTAYFKNQGAPVGYGATRAAAIADLKLKLAGVHEVPNGPVTASIRLEGAPSAMQTREFKHRADAQAWLDQQREIAERRGWGGYRFELHPQKRKAR